MSRADIETLRAGYEAISRGDWDTAFGDVHPDFEMKTADRMASQTYRGLEEVRRCFEDLLEPFEDVVTEPEEFFDRGNQIVVFVCFCALDQGAVVPRWRFGSDTFGRCETASLPSSSSSRA